MAKRAGHSENNQQLIGLARRRAFATYLRYGRLPDENPQPAECKASDPSVSTPPPAPRKATSHYVWRTVGDDRVRPTHAAREGRIFAWADAPPGEHPGTEPNCRCWAEPYYGDPAVPDALQPLVHNYQTDATGVAPWASFETLTRPDGSMAQSVVVTRDGTQIHSQFAGTMISRQVALATGKTVRVDTSAAVQSVYLGDDRRPLFQSAWTAHGPKVIRARQRVAFLGDPVTLIDPDFDPLDRIRNPFDAVIDPNPLGSLLVPGDAGGLGLAALALLALYAMQQAVPASQGLGETDRPVLVVKAWTVGADDKPVPIMAGSLTEEQLRRDCQYLPDVQKWTDEAASSLAPHKSTVAPNVWGSLVHGAVKRTIDALKAAFPLVYANLQPELSLSDSSQEKVPYGQKYSTRLDVVEDRSFDMGAVCDYDIKTGRAGLTPTRLKEIAERLASRYPGMTIFIIEVRPGP